MSIHRIAVSRHSVLPPIVPDSDKKFLDSIQRYIISEIEKVGCTEQGPAEEYYTIYRNVFDKIIEHVTAYKNILTSIKQEYDAFIEAIKKGQRNAFYLHGKLKVLASEPTTLVYYRKRTIQLEDKIKTIERNSARIQNLILKIRNIRKVPSTEALTPRKKINPAKPIPASAVSSISHIFEHDPSKSKEAEDLLEYIERFNELFSYGQYETAAVYAANCPRGILRNEETMMKFKALGAVKGRILPLLRYFEALISSSAAVRHPLCAAMTLEAIKCALSEKQLNLVMHWVTQQRLTFCEAAGDVIYDYGDVEPFNKSKCLALAQIAYNQCGMHKKAALCLCKQGQICGAMDYIQQFKNLSFDDYLFLLKNCPSIELIHCLTREWNGKPALLSIGATIFSLIDTDHKEHGLQLLKEIDMGEKNALEQVILNDTVCTLEGWKKIADTCAENKHEKLSQDIISILTSQEGVVQLSPLDDDDDAKIMEHVFL
ncbi:clathrin heavy chain linker domain-containing protein 1 isoform X2 [Emydura macquarii macquarii]|uniref:clathrin heavy chain linker domain-containing protein 1 isoform X2 n=1 Tax=Emydura macquarii macquarii TaxID=1129001 RepID=UPI00352A4A29